jgi:hypothetical protein
MFRPVNSHTAYTAARSRSVYRRLVRKFGFLFAGRGNDFISSDFIGVASV